MSDLGSMITKKIGKHIRRRRLEMGLRQVDLAERCGIHVNCVGRLERGKDDVYITTLIPISRVFQCTLDDLIYG